MFTCEICQKQFETEAALRGHILGAHKGEKQAMEQPKTKSNMSLTPEQYAIAQRAEAQDDSWMTISEADLNDFSLMNNPLDLPPEAAKEQNEKRYAFRWCERTVERVDQLTRGAQPPLRWAICNRNTTPFLENYIDDLLGCVTKLDQVLLVKPWAHHARVQAAKRELAETRDNTGTLKGKKDQIASDGIETYEGKEYQITGKDVVMADEAQVGDLIAE